MGCQTTTPTTFAPSTRYHQQWNTHQVSSRRQDKKSSKNNDLNHDHIQANQHAQNGQPAKTKTKTKTTKTIKNLIEGAAEHHPSLRAEHAAWLAQTHRANQALYTLPFPTLTYTFAPLPIETRLGAQKHSVAISQMLPWPGQNKLSHQVLTLAAEAREHTFDQTYLSLRFQITRAYWTLWANQQRQTLVNQQITLIQSIIQTAQVSVSTGKQPASNLAQLSMKETRQVDKLAALQSSQDTLGKSLMLLSEGDLNNYNISDFEQVFRAQPPLSPPSITPRDVLAGEPPPHILALLTRQKSIEQKLARQKLDQRPSILLGAQWSQIENNTSLPAPEAGRDAIMLKVGFTLPVWQKQLRAKADEIEAQTLENQYKIEQARLDWEQELHTTYDAILDTSRHLELLENTLMPQAKSSFELTLGDYTSAQTSVASLLNAMDDLLSIQLEVVDTKMKLANLLAYWEFITATPHTTGGAQ